MMVISPRLPAQEQTGQLSGVRSLLRQTPRRKHESSARLSARQRRMQNEI